MLFGKLLIKFDDMAQNMMQSGRIQLVHLSKMPSSPNIKYEKLGFKTTSESDTLYYMEYNYEQNV